uniref:Clathrin light chain n=1 Tax=Trichuris muris TaxID=70415 RepID=A0A5S6Q7R2_TRIMR
MIHACINKRQRTDEEQSTRKENPDLVADTKPGLIICEKKSETVGQIMSDLNSAVGQQAAASHQTNQAATEKVHREVKDAEYEDWKEAVLREKAALLKSRQEACPSTGDQSLPVWRKPITVLEKIILEPNLTKGKTNETLN